MGLSTQPTLLWVYCFSIVFCVCVWYGVYFWPCVHTCTWGPAPSSLKLNGRQPAVKLDCLSLSGGLSLPRWKKGERSGPKALLVEAHFEAFNVWQTLTHCQKHNDLQTAILSIKKVWHSHSIGPQTQSHTPIKSGKQWLSILSKRLYLAPTQKLAARIPVSQSIWLPDTVGTIPFVTQIQWFSEWSFSHILEPGADSIHFLRIVHYVSEQILKKRLPDFGFAISLEKTSVFGSKTSYCYILRFQRCDYGGYACMCMCWHMNFKVNLKTSLSLHKLVIIRFGNYCRDNLHTLLFLSLLAFTITLYVLDI